MARIIIRNHARTENLKSHGSLARLYELNGGQLVVLTISNTGK